MELKNIKNFFNNKKILITGHDGFKGTWLTYWLTLWDAKVCGISDKKSINTGHFKRLKLNIKERKIDIIDQSSISKIIKDFKPEIVFHLAAQPIVLQSYNSPTDTIKTNILGTSNILEVCRHNDFVKSLIIITSDKVYKNFNDKRKYKEEDQLGGKDIYSASKACTEILTNAYYHSFYKKVDNKSLVTARAGNVIGGGDWSEYRIVPDIFKSIIEQKNFVVRNPQSTRPWQHVLDCVFGYLLLAFNINKKNLKFKSYNFGPNSNNVCNVENLIKKIKIRVPELKFSISNKNNYVEENFLSLSSINSNKDLHWFPLLTLDESINSTIDWYENFISNNKIITFEQIVKYEKKYLKK